MDIYEIAREENIEPRLAYGLVKTESTFNERAVSPVGARGLTQVMPRTAAWLVPGTKTQDLYDRRTNLRLGFRYLGPDIAVAMLLYDVDDAEDVARKQGGERFSVLYPATLPTVPESPNILRLLIMAVGLGFALGAGLVVVREFLDRSVHDARSLQTEFEIPVLGEIPRIQELRS